MLESIIKDLNSAFDFLNEKLFYGEIQERPILTISPDVTKGAYGWCTSWRAWQGEKGEYYEINICAETLNRPWYDVVETLLHEMVHLYNLQEGIKDVSRGGTYHNKHFKETAEKVGLFVEKTEKYGFSKTALTMETKELIESQLNLEDFGIARPKTAKPEKKKTKNSSRKYVCPECGMSVRATKDVHIMCADCDVIMEREV